jgi:hypothetical protein
MSANFPSDPRDKMGLVCRHSVLLPARVMSSPREIGGVGVAPFSQENCSDIVVHADS